MRRTVAWVALLVGFAGVAGADATLPPTTPRAPLAHHRCAPRSRGWDAAIDVALDLTRRGATLSARGEVSFIGRRTQLHADGGGARLYGTLRELDGLKTVWKISLVLSDGGQRVLLREHTPSGAIADICELVL